MKKVNYVVIWGSLMLSSFLGNAWAETDEASMFLSKGDCQAWIKQDLSLCEYKDCFALFGGGPCTSKDCRAIKANNGDLCATQDCQALFLNDDLACSPSTNCFAIIDKKPEDCKAFIPSPKKETKTTVSVPAKKPTARAPVKKKGLFGFGKKATAVH